MSGLFESIFSKNLLHYFQKMKCVENIRITFQMNYHLRFRVTSHHAVRVEVTKLKVYAKLPLRKKIDSSKGFSVFYDFVDKLYIIFHKVYYEWQFYFWILLLNKLYSLPNKVIWVRPGKAFSLKVNDGENNGHSDIRN